MLVHMMTVATVTMGQLDDDGNVKNPTEYKFQVADHSDETMLELGRMVREHKAKLAAELAPEPEPEPVKKNGKRAGKALSGVVVAETSVA